MKTFLSDLQRYTTQIVLKFKNCKTCVLNIYFTKSQHVATLSLMPVGNHQATDSKKNKFTIIVLESDPNNLCKIS